MEPQDVGAGVVFRPAVSEITQKETYQLKKTILNEYTGWKVWCVKLNSVSWCCTIMVVQKYKIWNSIHIFDKYC